MQRQLQSRIGAPFSGIPPPMVGNYSDQWIVVKATVRPKLYEIGVVTSKGVCSLGEAALDVSRVVWQCYYIPSTQRTLDPFLGTIAFKRTLSRQGFKSLVENYPFIFKCGAFSRAEREYESIGNANISNIKVTSLAASNNVIGGTWNLQSGCILSGHTSQALCSNEVHFIGQIEVEKDRVLLWKSYDRLCWLCGPGLCGVYRHEVLFVHDKSPHQTEGVTATIVRASPDENILPVFEIIERQKECTWYRRPLQRVRVEMITSPSDPLRQLVIVYRWGVDRPFRLGPTNAMAYEVSGISYFGNNALFFPL
ncbi:hypothetical protein GGU10DRAFT_334262 [Lentinula aff. detonsa]|uniref:Uncharacterized protein n=1 Tax=Lentinula aff. detonsa TaxID=2804958 RepID=A0AA38KR43_9AGAR|nr:hypothetical protein GGU10DRAFT_334262 [Lentinula aff. detonsa]